MPSAMPSPMGPSEQSVNARFQFSMSLLSMGDTVDYDVSAVTDLFIGRFCVLKEKMGC